MAPICRVSDRRRHPTAKLNSAVRLPILSFTCASVLAHLCSLQCLAQDMHAVGASWLVSRALSRGWWTGRVRRGAIPFSRTRALKLQCTSVSLGQESWIKIPVSGPHSQYIVFSRAEVGPRNQHLLQDHRVICTQMRKRPPGPEVKREFEPCVHILARPQTKWTTSGKLKNVFEYVFSSLK